jgi:hypothetical protein
MWMLMLASGPVRTGLNNDQSWDRRVRPAPS